MTAGREAPFRWLSENASRPGCPFFYADGFPNPLGDTRPVPAAERSELALLVIRVAGPSYQAYELGYAPLHYGPLG